MADFDKPGTSGFDKMAANPAAPAGLKQGAQRFSEGQKAFFGSQTTVQPWSPSSPVQVATQWYSGANAESTVNGWDTDFYTQARNQQAMWANRAAEEDRGSVYYSQFDEGVVNPDGTKATGVAMWDDPKGKYVFGDVFLNGKKLEGQNVYESFGQETADLMMGQFLLDPKANSRDFQKADPKKYAESVNAIRQENKELALYSKSAEEYQAQIQRHEDSIVKGAGDDLLVTGGAAGGATLFAGVGAAIGAPFAGVGALPGAIIGGVVGGIVGGVGSWLNKDELTDLAARAATRQDQLKEQFDGFGQAPGWGFAASEWGGVASKLISPTSNLWRGVNEVQTGGRDDQTVDWYAVDTTTGDRKVDARTQAIDVAATFADAALQFSSAPGRALYMGQMSMVVAGKTAALTTGYGFNESRGEFDRYEGPGEWMAAFGSVGIDAAQMATGGLLGRVARHQNNLVARAAGEAEETAASRWLPKAVGERLARWDEGEVVQGWRVTRNADDTIAKIRPAKEAFVPSELAKAIPVGFRARQLARARQAEKATLDDYYNAAHELATGSTWRTSLITGYAEGVEEGVQAYLDPASFGEDAQWRGVMESVAYGAASGLGMGAGRLNRQVSTADQQDAFMRMVDESRTGVHLTNEEWAEKKAGMSPRALEALKIPTPGEDEAFKLQRQVIQDGLRSNAVRNTPLAIAGVAASFQESHEESLRKANQLGGDALVLHGATEDSLRLNGEIEQFKFDANTAVMSFDQLITSLLKSTDAIRKDFEAFSTELQDYIARRDAQEVLSKDTTQTAEARQAADELRAALDVEVARVQGQLNELGPALKAVNALIGTDKTTGFLIQAYADFKEETDPAMQSRMIEAFNQRIQDLYRGTGLPVTDDQGQDINPKAVKRVVEFLLPRHPKIDSGSYNVFVPQVSKMLTGYNAHKTVFVHQSVLKAAGADHDGDAVVQQFDVYLSEDDLARFRRGTQYLEQKAQEMKEVVDADGNVTNVPQTAEWVVHIDLPEAEEAMIELISWAGKDAAEEALVEQGLIRLWNRLEEHYVTNGPIDQLAFDEVMDRFVMRVQAGIVDARTKLVQELWAIDAEALFAMSDTTGMPEVTYLWSSITAAWESIQENFSMYTYARTQADDVPKELLDEDTQRPADQIAIDTRSALRAVTLGQDIAQLGGYSGTRQAQMLWYQPLLQSAVDISLIRREKTLAKNPEQALATAYMAIAGKTESDREALDNHNSVENRVLSWLQDMAEATVAAGETKLDAKELFLLIANIQVGDFQMETDGTYTLGTENDISMLQLLLRRSLQIEENNNPAMEEDSAKAKKIRKLRGLCYPTGAHSSTAAQVVNEVFGDIQLTELLGKDAFYLGPQLTLNQYTQMLLNQHPDQSRRTLDGFKRLGAYHRVKGLPDPPWDIDLLSTNPYVDGQKLEKPPEINGFTMLIQSIQSTVGAERARLKKQADETQEKFVEGLSDFQKQLQMWSRQYRGEIPVADKKKGLTLRDVYRDMLARQPRVAEDIAALIPAAARLSAFNLEADGIATEAQFIEDMMVEPDHQKAAVIYFVFTKLAEWNVLQGTPASLDAMAYQDQETGEWVVPKAETVARDQAIGRVNPRMIQSRYLETMYHLNQLPDGGNELRRFIDASLSAPSLGELFTQINENEPVWLFGRAPLHPFADDVTEFNPSPSDIYSSGSSNTQQREAITKFRDRMKIMVDALDESFDIEKNNRTLMVNLTELFEKQKKAVMLLVSQGKHPEDAWKQVRKQEADTENNGLLIGAEQCLENVRLFGDIVGPNVRQQVMEAFHEMLIRGHDKGKADPRLEPAGQAYALMDSPGFGTAMVLEMNAVHSFDWDDIVNNPSVLADGPARIQLKDGRILEIDLSSLEGALAALSHPATQAFARAVMFPLARDINPSGYVTLYQASRHAGEQEGRISDLALMIEESSFSGVFKVNDTNELDQAFRLIGFVEAFLRRKSREVGSDVDGYYPISRMIHNILEAYQTTAGTGRSPEEAERLRNRLVIQVADALKTVGLLENHDLVKEVQARVVALMAEQQWGDSSALEEIEKDVLDKANDDVQAVGIFLATMNTLQTAKDVAFENYRDLQNSGIASPEDLKAAKDLWQAAEKRLLSFMKDPTLEAAPPQLARDFNSVHQMFQLSFEPDQADGDLMRKAAMLAYITDGGKYHKFEGVSGKLNITLAMQEEREESFPALIDKFRKAVHEPHGGVVDVEAFDPFDEEEWKQLSIWCTLLHIEERSAWSATSVKSAPANLGSLEEFARLHDTSWSFLLDTLFDKEIYNAIKLMTDLGNNAGLIEQRKRKTNSTDIGNRIAATIMNKDLLGEWNSRIPINIMTQELALRQARVGSEIAKAGNYPKIFGPWIGVFRPSFLTPEADAYSQATLAVATGEKLHTKFDVSAYVKLHHHFVRTVKMVAPDGTELDLMRTVADPDNTNDETKGSGLWVLDTAKLFKYADELSAQPEYAQGYTIEIEYVDVDKKPHEPKWAHNRFFDGRGRNPLGRSDSSLVSDMLFSLNAESKEAQQGPLNALTKGGQLARMIEAATRAAVAAMETGSFAEVMKAKAWHLLVGDYDLSKLSLDDLTAMYQYVKSRHVVVGRNPDTGKKEVWWVEEYISRQERGLPIRLVNLDPAKPNDPPELVALSMTNAQKLLGGTGFNPYDYTQPPSLNAVDYNRWPQLTEQRMKELGLERLGEPAALEDAPVAQFLELSKSRMYTGEKDPVNEKRRHDLVRWVRNQNDQAQTRMQTLQGDKNTFKSEKVNKKAKRKLQKLLKVQDSYKWLKQLGIPSSGNDRQELGRSWQAYRKMIDRMGANGVAWEFDIGLDENNIVDGMLGRAGVEGEGFYEDSHIRPAYGDVVIFNLAKFVDWAGGDDVVAAKKAVEIADAFARQGLTIVLGSTQPGSDLRKIVAEHLTEGPTYLSYRQMNEASGNFYEPIISPKEANVTADSLESTQLVVEEQAGQNISLNLIVNDRRINENGRIVNDAHAEIFRRVSLQLIPTNFMMQVSSDNTLAFGIPVQELFGEHGDQFDQIASQITEIASTKEGKDQLLKMMGEYDKDLPIYTKHENDTYTPGIRDKEEALDRFLEALAAGQQPLREGREVMAGDLYLMVGSRGEVLIHRVGFQLPKPSTKGYITSQWGQPFEAGNSTLKVAFTAPKIEALATLTPPFTIDTLMPDHQGIMLHGRFELGWALKMIYNGVKTTTIPMAEGEEFIGPLSIYDDNGFWINSMTSVPGQDKKGGVRHVANNFRDVFALTGMDFRGDLIELMLPGDPRTFTEKWNEIEPVLNAYARMNNSMSASQARDVLSGGNWMYEFLFEANDQGKKALGEAAWINLIHPSIDRELISDEQRLAMILLVTMGISGITPSQVVSMPGALTLRNGQTSDAVIGFFPPVMTDAMENHRWPGLHNMLIKRANGTFKEYQDPDTGKMKPGSWFSPDFKFHTTMRRLQPDGSYKTFVQTGDLQIETPLPADENAITAAFAQPGARDASLHNARVDSAQGGIVVLRKKKGDLPSGLDQFYGDNEIERFDSTEDTVWDFLTRILPDQEYVASKYFQPMEQLHWDRSDAKVGQYLRQIPREDGKWDWGKLDKILDILGLEQGDKYEFDYLVRQWFAAPAPADATQVETVTNEMYLEAIEQMYINLKTGMHPLHGADVPYEHEVFWRKVFLAQQGRGDKAWTPLMWETSGKHGTAAVSGDKAWGQWVDALTGQILHSKRDIHAAFRADIDGFMHTYQNATRSYTSLPLSDDEQVTARLMDGETNEPYISLDPGVRALLHSPPILETMVASWATIAGHEPVYRADSAHGVDASEQARRTKSRNSWLERNRMARQKPVKMIDYARDGVEYRENVNSSNAFLRGVVHLSIATRLMNPALYVSALLEVPMRQAMDNVTNLLLGENVGLTGKLQAGLLESKAGKKIGLDNIHTMLTHEQMKKLDKLGKQFGSDPEWRGDLFGEMTYQNKLLPGQKVDSEGNPVSSGRIGRGLETAATWAARVFNDPTLGMRQRTAGKRYIMAAIEYLAMTNNLMDIDALFQQLEQDRMWLKKHSSKDMLNAHRAGVNSISQVRSTKGTVFGDFIMRPVDSLYASDTAGKALIGTALKIPMMFTRFNVNSLITLTGMSAADQALGMFLDGKRTPKSVLKMMNNSKRSAEDQVQPEYMDYSDVLETMDLQRLVLRGAVTQTGLFTLGLIGANILGLGGEDEEERRRRKMERYLGLPHIYDPSTAQADFLYSDAIWLDDVPILNTLFKSTMMGDEERIAVVPHWMIRQWTSPLMGMVRFFQTGDARNIVWGFQDAASVIPTSALYVWRDANAQAEMLNADIQDLDSARENSAEANNKRLWMFASIVGIYEKALIENQFINTIRTAFDEVDRNPYAIPDTTKSGDIVKKTGPDGVQIPVAQEEELSQYETEQMVDPVTGKPMLDPRTGEPVTPETRLRYARRTGINAVLHQYAENNATASVLLSLFTGQNPSPFGGDSTFNRQNMVAKSQLVPTNQLSKKQAEATILAAWYGVGAQELYTEEEIAYVLKYQYEKANIRWNQPDIDRQAKMRYKQMGDARFAMSVVDENSREVITKGGAQGIYRGLLNGYLDFDSPSLQGLAIPETMRDEIAKEWKAEVLQEAINMGASATTANFRWKRIWFGDKASGQPGLREFLYSNKIPDKPFAPYTQLNTTYMIGPDGRPWATPFSRSMIGAVLPAAQTMATPADGTHLDARGNVVNELTNTNTGLKAVVPGYIVSNLDAKDKMMEKEEGAEKKTADWSSPYGRYWGGRGYSRGGYSRGGGYSSSDYKTPMFTDKILRSIRAGYGPQMAGVYTPNADKPIIRRADVRRERYSSERGRLKQWQ